MLQYRQYRRYRAGRTAHLRQPELPHEDLGVEHDVGLLVHAHVGGVEEHGVGPAVQAVRHADPGRGAAPQAKRSGVLAAKGCTGTTGQLDTGWVAVGSKRGLVLVYRHFLPPAAGWCSSRSRSHHHPWPPAPRNTHAHTHHPVALARAAAGWPALPTLSCPAALAPPTAGTWARAGPRATRRRTPSPGRGAPGHARLGHGGRQRRVVVEHVLGRRHHASLPVGGGAVGGGGGAAAASRAGAGRRRCGRNFSCGRQHTPLDTCFDIQLGWNAGSRWQLETPLPRTMGRAVAAPQPRSAGPGPPAPAPSTPHRRPSAHMPMPRARCTRQYRRYRPAPGTAAAARPSPAARRPRQCPAPCRPSGTGCGPGGGGGRGESRGGWGVRLGGGGGHTYHGCMGCTHVCAQAQRQEYGMATWVYGRHAA